MPELLAVPTPDGAALAAELHPGEGVPVVLLHAGVADRRAWTAVAERLNAGQQTVVAYDRRGFGQTPATEAPFRDVDDLLAVLDAVAPHAPAHVVGNSMGGRIALDLALQRPDRVKTLTLIAPAVSGAPDPPNEELDDATRAIADEIDDAEELGDADALNRLERRLWLDGPAAPEGRVTGPARELFLEMNGIAIAEAAEALEDPAVNAYASLETIAVPTTIAYGGLDVPLIVARCKTLAERLPDVRKVVAWPDLAHVPMLERPDLVAELVGEATREA